MKYSHRIPEYAELEGTPQDHRVWLLLHQKYKHRWKYRHSCSGSGFFLRWPAFPAEGTCWPSWWGQQARPGKGASSKAPTGCEQQDWSGQGGVRERQLWVSTCLSENWGSGEKCSLKPFGVSPSLLPGPQGGCLGGCHSGAGGSRQSIIATVGKASASEQGNYARGQRRCSWQHQSPLLLANKWWLPPCPAIGPGVTSPNKIPAQSASKL